MYEFKKGDRVLVVLSGHFPKYLGKQGVVHIVDEDAELIAVDFGEKVKQVVLGYPGFMPHQLQKI